jgi:GTP cyclohydrolase I
MVSYPMNPDFKKAAAAIDEFLGALDLPSHAHEETQHTGKRVTEAFFHDLLSGYRQDPAELLGHVTLSQAASLVVVTDVPVVMVCPHHLLPSTGVGHVGYLPHPNQPRVVGLGALADVLNCYARRLTLQENVTHQVAHALVEHLGAHAAACTLRLSHGCITCRGERRTGTKVFTVSYAGPEGHDTNFRSDFWRAVQNDPTD